MKAKIKKNKSWQDKRIDAINRKLKKFPCRDVHEYYVDEYYNVCNSKANSKKEYKNSLAYVLAVEKSLGFKV